jgi:hypothetical protein
VTYKQWAGIVIKGSTKWEATSVKRENHLEKAAWLTACVEGGGVFGSVQSYDGCGMSAGLEHCIGLLPRSMEPGSLWGLLSKIDEALPDTSPTWIRMKNALGNVGWYLDTKGVLRKKDTGAAVTGQEIRNELSPVAGVVPESGPDFEKAVRWAETFNKLFEDPATFACQIRQTKNGLLESHKILENTVYSRYCKIENASAALVGTNISNELDLAMCIYHSFSVNAPSKARSVLEALLGQGHGPLDFSKLLVKNLGTNSYANWKERYSRTRKYAKESGLFEESLFTSVAPVNL